MRESLDFKFSSQWVKLHREIKWLTLKKKSFGTIFKFKLPKNSTLCHYEIMLSGIQTDLLFLALSYCHPGLFIQRLTCRKIVNLVSVDQFSSDYHRHCQWVEASLDNFLLWQSER